MLCYATHQQDGVEVDQLRRDARRVGAAEADALGAHTRGQRGDALLAELALLAGEVVDAAAAPQCLA
jgi:hypothetical protein